MKASLVQRVWMRAGDRCEYCRVPQAGDASPFHIDHIVPRQHMGRTVASNLALACYACNLRKGPNLVGRDPKSRAIVRLFHPRRQKWSRHFRWKGAQLVGRSAVGRATIATLGINLSYRIQLREALIEEGVLRQDD